MLSAKVGLSLLCGFGEDDKTLLVHDNDTNKDNNVDIQNSIRKGEVIVEI